MNVIEMSMTAFSSVWLFLVFSFLSLTIGTFFLSRFTNFKSLFGKRVFFVAAFLVGWVLIFNFHYWICYLSSFAKWDGFWICNLLASLGFLPCFFYWRKFYLEDPLLLGENFFRKIRSELIFYVCSFFVIFFCMQYSFSEDEINYYVGSLVWADFGPHLAMIRSFSRGFNFPTHYPHFAEDGIRYHFFFHYMVAVFERLGWTLSFSMNFFSSLGYLFFLRIFAYYTKLISKDLRVTTLSICAFFLRGSLGFIVFFGSFYFWEYAAEFLRNREFFGLTMRENWGLFSLKVYINQRHLGWGLAVFFLVLSFITKSLEQASSLKEQGGIFKDFTPIFWGFFLGMFAFWNGACVLMAMLVLCAFYVLRRNLIAVAMSATLFVIEAKLQSSFFAGSLNSPLKFLWNFGFLSQDKSIIGVWQFLVMLLGVSFLLLPLCWLSLSRFQRRALGLAAIPFLWGMCLQITPDIYLNHKFILMSLLAYWPFYFLFLIKMWDLKKLWARSISVFLCILSLGTGFLDIPALLLSNGKNSSVKLEKESPLQLWIEAHTDYQDVFLSYHYVLSPVQMAGRSVFYGWPYYAWSAGHDTIYRRDRLRLALKSSGTFRLEALKNLGIDYVLWDEELKKDPELLDLQDAIREHFELVYKDLKHGEIYKLNAFKNE